MYMYIVHCSVLVESGRERGGGKEREGKWRERERDRQTET